MHETGFAYQNPHTRIALFLSQNKAHILRLHLLHALLANSVQIGVAHLEICDLLIAGEGYTLELTIYVDQLRGYKPTTKIRVNNFR